MKRIASAHLRVFLLAAVLAVVGLTSCGKSEEAISVWIGGSIVGEDELEQAQDQWIFAQLLKEYETQYGVKVKLTYFEDEEAMVQLVANNGRSGNEVPDIACLYSSEILRDMADVVYPVTDNVSDEEKQNIMFWETVTNNGKSVWDCDEILGYPVGGTEVTFMAYNKAIFSEVGIDVETNPPQTFADFETLCQTLHDQGITPIVGSDGGWNEVYLQVFAKEWLQRDGDEGVMALSAGQASFMEDLALRDSLTTAERFYKNGYINKDYATNNDAVTLFANGQGAMFSCSNYDLNLFSGVMGDNLGAFILPDHTGNVEYEHISFGGCNQCLSTFQASPHREEAIALIKWLSSKENNIRMVKAFGCFPNRSDITLEEYDEDPSEIITKIYPLLPYAHSTPDYLMPMNLYTEFYRGSLSVMIGQTSVNDFTAEMDALVHG